MTLRPELQGDDPILLFHDWLALAEAHEPNDPNAAALATSSSHGLPNVRMVLIKSVDPSGFSFYTNASSQKGHELQQNPNAALCFHWKSLRRQVRATGPVHQLPESTTNTYFHSRSRRSQISAAVSQQSHPLLSRQQLEQQVAAFEQTHQNGEIPKPASWHGYSIQPQTLEFWIDGADRLHDRLLFTRQEGAWSKTLLYP